MKAVVSLLLIVLAPLVVIVWLGLHWIQSDLEQRQRSEQKIVKHQLRLIDQRFTEIFYGIEKRLRSVSVVTLSSAGNGVDVVALRELVRREPLVSFMFILNAERERVFPPQDKRQLSRKEALYFDQATYLNDPSAFGRMSEKDPQNRAMNEKPSIRRNNESRVYGEGYLPKEPLQLTKEHWIVFYSQNQINQIFWYLGEEQNTVGFQLDPIRVMAMIIEALPDTLPKDDLFFNSRVRLRKAGSQTIYEWGNYEPNIDSEPTIVYPLSHPLGAWQLEYFAAREEKGLILRWGAFLVLLFAVGSGSIGLAYSLHRTQRKERDEALQKVSFVNQVSHELKTPLTNIRMYAELLQGRLFEADQKVQHFTEVIILETEHLSRLVHNVLSFGKSQSNKLNVQRLPGVLDEVVYDAIEKFIPTFNKKAITVNLNLNAGEVVLLDKFAMELILNNLLSNVEKYAGGGGKVDVSTTYRDGCSEITVRDWGPGIPDSESLKIFEAFYRVYHTTTEGVAGTGIGLNIARQLAELHGGSLNLEPSEKGAVFIVRLETPPKGSS